MTDIRVIIREFSRGTSLREMERKLELSRTSLRAYRDRAEASGYNIRPPTVAAQALRPARPKGRPRACLLRGWQDILRQQGGE